MTRLSLASLEDPAASYSQMGPTMLSRTPVEPRRQITEPDPEWDDVYRHLEQQMNSDRQWRWSFWTHWSRLAEYFNPRRYVWLVVANKMWRGGQINDSIIDSTGLLAVRTCSTGMWSGLTNPARPWFKYESALSGVELDADAKEWIEDTQRRIYKILDESNFYEQMAAMFGDLTVFATSPVIVYEDDEDVIRLYLPAPGEYYLGMGGRNSVDRFSREFTYTVQQIVDMFQLENCPQKIQILWAEGGGSHNLEFVVCHTIEPNFPIQKRGQTGRKAGSIQYVPAKFTWREVYWLKADKGLRPLSKRGFNETPFAAFRWATTSNDAYGRGPCMDALGDNKQVQRETLRKAEFIEKGVRPPMGADPALKNEPASTMPGQTTYCTSEGQKKGFWPLFEVNAAWLPAMTQDIAMVNARIEKGLYVEVFMAITRMAGVQPRNELELTKRDLERLQELGPVIRNAEGQLSIMLRRIMAIAERRKLLKPMPESLLRGGAGGGPIPLKISYTSIMRLAQVAAESVALKDTLAVGGQLSSAAKAAGIPDPLREMDLGKAWRRYAENNNCPSDLFFTEEQVKAHDDAREKGQQQAQQPGQMAAMVDAAKNLSQANLSPNNALGAMLGPTGAPPA
jgi:hypothetical protein